MHRHNEVVLPDGQRSGIAARIPRLRTPFARAVVPVAGGLLVMALILGATWLVAAFIARGGADSTERLAPPVFQVGVERYAQFIESEGPVLFPGLNTTTGKRSLVLDHTGDDPTMKWVVRWAHPDDRPESCTVDQVRGTREFTDCDDRRIDVTELQPGDGVCLTVENRRLLSLDLRRATGALASTVPCS